MIAEGNLSVAIGEIWMNGYSSYKGIILNNEAKEAGRIRPAHWLLHQIPFFITLIRNGDIISNYDGKDIGRRINGDLQTHTIVLLTFLTLAVASMAYVLLTISQSWLACLLFIIFFSGSLTINDNLFRGYCDSGEIYQLFFISLYVFCFLMVWRLTGFLRIFFEVGAVVFLLFAYAIKETTLTMLPVATVSFIILYFRCNFQKNLNRSMLFRQFAWHLIFAFILIIAIYSVKSNGYSRNYVLTGSDYYSRIQTSLDFLRLGFDTGYLFTLSFLSLLLIGFAITMKYLFQRNAAFLSQLLLDLADKILLTLMAFGGCLAFVSINLPWQFLVPKYLIVAYFFLAFGLAALQSVIFSCFDSFSFKWISILFVLVLGFFSAKEATTAYNIITNNYDAQYQYIDSVPVISNDIATDSFKFGSINSRIILNNLFQDDGLSFYRQINLLQGVNILQEGKLVSKISAQERNYFHIIKNAPTAHLDFDQRLRQDLPQNIDTLYVYNQFYDAEAQHILEAQGFVETNILALKAKNIVRKFRRLEKDFNQSTQVLLSFGEFKYSLNLLEMHEVELKRKADDYLLFKATGGDPYLLLPPVNATGVKAAVLRLVLNSPQTTTITLFHRSSKDPGYSETRRYSRSLNVGENELFFYLPAENLTGPLRLDPGEVEGEYLLRDLELRTIIPSNRVD